MLTTRQKKFAQELLRCKTYTEAAINAGYSPKHARKSAYQAKNQKYLKEFIDHHRQNMNKDFIFSAQDKLKILQKGIQECCGEGKWKEVSSLTKVHNDMMGDNAPTKTLSVTIEATVEEIEQLRLKYEKDY